MGRAQVVSSRVHCNSNIFVLISRGLNAQGCFAVMYHGLGRHLIITEVQRNVSVQMEILKVAAEVGFWQ